MRNPLVTVIVPVYNAEAYLKRCVDSILAQTYCAFEIILIDDGSSDDSPALCDAYAAEHDQITVLHQPNSGPAAARNAGMAAAKGEYFVCVDSDDFVELDYLAQLVDAAAAHPEAGHIRCGFQTIVNGAVDQIVVYSEDEAVSLVPREQYMLFFTRKLAQSPCNCLYRTSVVRDHGLQMPVDLSLGEDMLFNLQYMDAEDRTAILVINRPLYDYVFSNQDSLVSKYRPDLYQINRRLVLSLKQSLEKWRIEDAESWQLFWNWAYNYFDAVIGNYRKKADEDMINLVLHDLVYREALNKKRDSLNPILYLALKSGHFKLVEMVYCLSGLKSRTLHMRS